MRHKRKSKSFGDETLPFHQRSHFPEAIPFRSLLVGQHFRLIGGPPAQVRKKVSKKCYVFAGKYNVAVKHRSPLTGRLLKGWLGPRMTLKRTCYTYATSLDSNMVVPLTRRSLVKKRKGSSRGPAVFAGRR